MLHYYKLVCLFFSSFLFSQTIINITQVPSHLDENQIIRHQYAKFQSVTNFKKKSHFFLNHKNSDSPLSWFYSMGPYNDTWGSDILKVNNAEGKRPISYYPFGNSILSFQSQHQNRYSDKSASVYLNILGFNLKKLKTSNAKHLFYGSE